MPESESLLRTDEGFEAFYTRHYKLVYRTCFSYMKNTADAEDCTEVYLRGEMWRKKTRPKACF